MIDGDVRANIEEQIALCKRASEAGVLILFRNDDESIIVTNATDPVAARTLGEALACGYTQEG